MHLRALSEMDQGTEETYLTISRSAFYDLDTWIDKNGWAGYDPYDIRGQDWFLLFRGQSKLQKKTRSVLSLVEKAFDPLSIRKFLRIKKEINPKGMGLLASGYISAYKATKNEVYLHKATSILNWLADNCSDNHSGKSWGYPFHWNSRIFIPKYTPSVVVTGVVGAAFLDYYELTGDEKFHLILNDIATFFMKSLNRPVNDTSQVCFSYTPLDQFKVLNASMFAAAFLARLSIYTDETKYADLAIRAARYVISEQRVDGGFNYWGSEENSVIDHYHTGFVLRNLDIVSVATGSDFIIEPVKRGYDFYLKNLFSNGVPKRTPEQLYPIDIHSCAEAILCLNQFQGRYGGKDYLEDVVRFTLTNMQHDDGWFIYQIVKKNNNEFKLNIPYMRWGQSWMILALARLL